MSQPTLGTENLDDRPLRALKRVVHAPRPGAEGERRLGRLPVADVAGAAIVDLDVEHLRDNHLLRLLALAQ